MLKKIESKKSMDFGEYAKLNNIVGYKPGKGNSVILINNKDEVFMIVVSKKADKSKPLEFNVLLDGAHGADWLVAKAGNQREFTKIN